ncbi:MAG: beta-ketoacyl-ACP synthase 3 [Pirellulales bacterium]
MDRLRLERVFRAMLVARYLDDAEQRLVQRGEAVFHVPGTGHEGSAALAPHLTSHDWLHCHYRQKALLIARGVTPRAYLAAHLCKDDSSSRGRQMSGFMSDPALHVLSMVVPTGNQALQAAGVAAAVRDQATRPIVVCGIGDGSTQQGEFLEGIGQAVRARLPVLFFIEDNRWAISTRTAGRTFFSLPGGLAQEYLGATIHYVDGRDVATADQHLGEIVARMRETREPGLVVFQVERLSSHTNADDQTVYRPASDLSSAALGDPLVRCEAYMADHGWSASELQQLREAARREVSLAEDAATLGPEPLPNFCARRPTPIELLHPSRETTGEGEPELTMRQSIGEVLRWQLENDARVCLLGEDIEDPKGDVFGVTRGLSTRFPQRVCNSPLSESTILGEAIGRALAGQRPVAFLQFADFLPLAYNQIVNELASIGWRTDHQWSAPVIVMVACGAYRPGLGPFHAQTFESVLAHAPGIDVVMPSTAADAAGLLNAAFRTQRPTFFLYPKSLLNDPNLATSRDIDRHFAPIGVSRKARVGRDITLVGWGNTVRLCMQTAQALERAGVEAEVLDLRSISPWDQQAVLASAEKTARLVVVHEDNQTCGLGGEILATVAEKSRVPVAMRRVARPDTFVPCNFSNQIQVLPSFERVLGTAAELLNMDLEWQRPAALAAGLRAVEAIGSAPSDETVIVCDLLVKVGDQVEPGTPIASLEASKSVFELASPFAGTVERLAATAGQTVRVGEPLLLLRSAASETRRKPVVKEEPGVPILTRRAHAASLRLVPRDSRPRQFDVGVSQVVAVTGSRTVTNEEFLRGGHGMTSEDIIKRTGIESRHWAGPGETAANMAVKASRELLERERLLLDDLDLVICSTTSPTVVTPSLACQVLSGLGNGRTDAMLQAFDISAACSGYLYALQAGYDFLQSRPDGRVLLVTAEVLSPLVDMNDFDTAILFGDAASATVLYGESHFERAKARLLRPELSAKGEDGQALSIPFHQGGHIHMKGQKVFSEAVRAMVSSLTRLCDHKGLRVRDLKLVVPHQANQRILDAVQNRIEVPVFSNIRRHGNTSSSSIPLCLTEVLEASSSGDHLGLCAFGGGFTFGAGILQTL